MFSSISVVIPTFNRKELLSICLSSLINQDFPRELFEIIVINDGSSDGTEKYLKYQSKILKNLKIVSQDNFGHAVARNIGFSLAQNEIIASLDDDCIPCSDWLRMISNEFQVDPYAAVLCGKILNPTMSRVAWAGYLIDFSLWIGEQEKDSVHIAYIGNTAYQRKIIQGIKLQNDGLSYDYRDSIFNYEIIKRGYRVKYCPRIKVLHYKWHRMSSYEQETLFIREQIRRGRGFRHGGYKIHGKLGRLYIKFPCYCYIIIKAGLIMMRSIYARLFRKYMYCFNYIILGLKFQYFGITNASE